MSVTQDVRRLLYSQQIRDGLRALREHPEQNSVQRQVDDLPEFPALNHRLYTIQRIHPD